MRSAESDVRLSDRIAQADPNAVMSGGDFTVSRRFWHPLVPCDVNKNDGVTFDDGRYKGPDPGRAVARRIPSDLQGESYHA